METPTITSGGQNVKVEHQDTTAWFQGSRKDNKMYQKIDFPVVDKKLVEMRKYTSIKHDKIQIKYKKLQQYLNQGYTQV